MNNVCRICGKSMEQVISFGQMPIANAFLSKEQFADEYFFELAVAFCEKCTMLQLLDQPAPEQMFHDNYAFFSSTSQRMAEHFREFAQTIRSRFLTGDDCFVAEIGSNDGIMLKNFAAAGIRHLGIEPSENVAKVAIEQGVNTISRFFDEQFASEIVAEHGQADAFLSANCMCHIPTLHSVAEGIRLLLKPTGVLAFEDPYAGDIIEKTSYDQIYDEHAFYFSVLSVSNLFEQHGLEIFDVEPQKVHGGSMRYYIGHRGAHPVSDRVVVQRNKEQGIGLGKVETYHTFRQNVERSRDELLAVLRQIKRENGRVAGYAATSKSTTVTNYCGITPELVEYISDTTPLKQGKFSPGAHIPVRPYEQFSSDYPDYALLFGWNHAREILAKERAYAAAGGRWIVYVPKVKVVEGTQIEGL